MTPTPSTQTTHHHRGKFIISVLDETHLFVKADKVDFVKEKVRLKAGGWLKAGPLHRRRVMSRTSVLRSGRGCQYSVGALRVYQNPSI